MTSPNSKALRLIMAKNLLNRWDKINFPTAESYGVSAQIPLDSVAVGHT